MEYDDKCQLLIIGDSTVGKTSILNRYTQGNFSTSYLATVGLDFFTKDIQIGDKIVRVKIWDTAGQERFRSFTYGFYRNANGILLAYDVSNAETFDNLKFWLQSLQTHSDDKNIIVLLGNKVDLPREITKEDGERFANEYNFKYFETSSKTGQGVEESINYLVNEVMKKKAQQPRKDQRSSIVLGQNNTTGMVNSINTGGNSNINGGYTNQGQGNDKGFNKKKKDKDCC